MNELENVVDRADALMRRRRFVAEPDLAGDADPKTVAGRQQHLAATIGPQ